MRLAEVVPATGEMEQPRLLGSHLIRDALHELSDLQTVTGDGLPAFEHAEGLAVFGIAGVVLAGEEANPSPVRTPAVPVPPPTVAAAMANRIVGRQGIHRVFCRRIPAEILPVASGAAVHQQCLSRVDVKSLDVAPTPVQPIPHPGANAGREVVGFPFTQPVSGLEKGNAAKARYGRASSRPAASRPCRSAPRTPECRVRLRSG